MAKGVCRLLRAPRIADPETRVLSQLANRERNFLETVRTVIFANAENPYNRMFRLAGCSHEDLKGSVERDGLETALSAIHRAGIYLSHDEFKGKRPIVRSGQTIPSTDASFLNPLVSGSYQSRSGGSRSSGTVTLQSLEHQLYRECYHYFLDREFSLGSRAFVGVMPILPSAWGLGQCLQAARRGNRFERWFTTGGTLQDSGHYRAVTKIMVILARAMGAEVPFPTYFELDDFSPPQSGLPGGGKKGSPRGFTGW